MAVVEEFDYLCRLCAAKTGILMGLPIFEAGDQMRNIDKKIAACLPVQVSLTDQLPKVVCEECAFKLDQLFDFREKCLHTEGMFMEMLKEIGKEDVMNGEDVQSHTTVVHEAAESTIHTMQVMDEMDLAGGEQVVSQEEIGQQDADIQVTGIDCLDGDTVSNHQIAMHLDGDMTVVGNLSGPLSQLGINYVTSISATDQSQEQIVHYCENVKYETGPIKQEYHRLQDRLTTEEPQHVLENNVSGDNFTTSQDETKNKLEESCMNENGTGEHVDSVNALPSTSQINGVPCEIMVKYTKRTKRALLESTLSNPTIDETGSHWYVCPFCNEAALETTNLAAHFEQHFCCCPCGLYFTSVEVLSLHKEQCDVYKNNVVDNKEKKDAQLDVAAAVPSQESNDNPGEQKKQSTFYRN
ncbi:hypothetical protein DMN91_001829 [Ooceraea biroi]|uniref:ZAD domain-containing protein n=1 Tax=Ooceraea biroi TaxID=2015173 RepID=A0A3L8DZE5_OOCBI|nr:hypothetical protein DMN91_001829 [Ooceraea biroi]